MVVKTEDYTGPKGFVSTHTHSILSPLDGVATPVQYAEQCIKLGHPAIALTEHGNMASVPDMYFACKKLGVKYLSGCEIYYNDYEPLRQKMAHDGKSIKDADSILAARIRQNRHLTILCKNEIGFHNLIKLTTLAYKFGYYYKPRIWFDKLCEFKEGLIVLSGCINGPLAHECRLDIKSFADVNQRYNRLKGRDLTAKQYLTKFKQEFGDDFYVEVQMPCIPDEIPNHQEVFGSEKKSERPPAYDPKVFQYLTSLANEHKVSTVLSTDSHYIYQDDFYIQKVMMAVGQRTTIDNPGLFYVNSDQQYFKSRAELWATFKNGPYSKHVSDNDFEAMCDNTLLIAEKCEQLKLDTNPKIPDWSQIVPGVNADNELQRLVATELKKRGLHKITKKYLVDGREVTYVEQAKIELNRFIDKGFASYFLITRDLLQYGARRGWPFGPRGCTIPSALINISVNEQKRIEDINIGDSIIDGFGNYQIVENKFIYDVSEELFVLELDGRTIEITSDHKLYIIRDGIVTLLKAYEIKETDEIIGHVTSFTATSEPVWVPELGRWGRAFDGINEYCFVPAILFVHREQSLSLQTQNIDELQKLVLAGYVERLRINCISKRPYVGQVYDLQVSNTHTYRLNGVFSSNSASGSLVCFLLDLHNLNPLIWGLSFDRFLASSRGGYMLKVRMD